ncbi:tRNA epoxyqueuosine(34) reductase QueG [Psychrobium sp. 1_MG-2023]|uniref:tRNA epoxyqueuosine(34) reductase QueG n=1 Tax=Psychrobium sp. 1_MG-2023 TaxID=3062624 RepID=UPI0027348D32|nr:tRNA epoxyqueuosine(34) reductase QueG [Psychrobium sp. 1_MG-2023]MDP2562064.1 tRNA epoxyqueuosine(34) reductase QueG [Psychrobium sp. 1_MG-2023]
MNESICYQQLAQQIEQWAIDLGFTGFGICDTDLSQHEAAFQQWLDNGYHGGMEYMARHGMMRARPNELLPGTLRVISVRLDYLPPDALIVSTMKEPTNAYISRYATGRDYHKIMRNRLKKLQQKIETQVEGLIARPFVDSAPILERPLAEKAGLGWVGKHTLILNQDVGSFFFLGELLVSIPLPVSEPVKEQCGSCVACITICPTQAIVEPYVVDGRRCLSYITIEKFGEIPVEFRKAMGNRIYGCDDCQLICPWNKFAQASSEDDFKPRKDLHSPQLLSLFAWDEATFLKRTEGSPIRRIGHERWLRNIAVALGNAPYEEAIVQALKDKREEVSELVQEHIDWAIAQQQEKTNSINRKTLRMLKAVERGMPAHQ